MKYKLIENGTVIGYSDAMFSNYTCIELTEYEKKELENEKHIEELRILRDSECFSIINRGQLWYNSLTEEQLAELQVWYKTWLDVTETKTIPEKPTWLK